MIKVSRLADYAVVILAALDNNDGTLMSASGLAMATHLPEPTVAKVLKLLAKYELVNSIRGAGGGYTLAKAADQIGIAHIITAVDGPIALTACVDGAEDCCAIEKTCSVKGRWNPINAAIQNSLEKITLADMTA